MTAAWSCAVVVGEHTFLVEQAIDEEVADAPAVLDDLRFGWSMPTNGLYPTQPDAMSAEFALNLPVFSDYSDLAKGDPVQIELRVPADGNIVASFYGRVTDATARPRDRREEDEDGGVTLDVVAIDYTVDPAEQRGPETGVLNDPLYEYDVLQSAFFNGFGGVLPGDIDGIPTLWTSPTDVVVPDTILVGPDRLRAFEQVAAMLQQAVNSTAGTRMILSPLIVAGELPSGRRFTIDTIEAHPETALDFILDASAVDMDVTWQQVKGDAPDRVVATYGPSSLQAVATMTGATEPYVDIPLQLHLPDAAGARAAEVAAWYLPLDLAELGWQVKALTFYVDQMDPETLLTFPGVLFPRWFWDEGEPERADCYNAQIVVFGADATVVPEAIFSSYFGGYLAGATAQIRDGLLSFDLALRAVQHIED